MNRRQFLFGVIPMVSWVKGEIATADKLNSTFAGTVGKVASMSALKGLRIPQDGDALTIVADCYSTSGDGGGGVFYWNASDTRADDGGTVINPTNYTGAGRWNRHLFGQPATQKHFGAVGDGSTDDTSAIQAAFNYIANGGTLSPAAGTHKVTNFISVTLGANAKVRVEGQGAVTFVSAIAEPAQESSIIKFQGNGTQDISLRNITVQHNATTYGLINGIEVNNVANAVLHSVKGIQCSLRGIKLFQVLGGSATDCQGRENKQMGLGMTGCQDFNTYGGQFVHNGIDANIGGYGISCEPGSGTYFNKNIIIHSPKCYDNIRKGVDVHNGTNVTVIAPDVANPAGLGMTGFGCAGVYAVNEDNSKMVQDFTLLGGMIDCAGATAMVKGVYIGAYGANATASGDFNISSTRIKNTNGATGSNAVYVANPSNANAVDAVNISNIQVTNGCPSGDYIIQFTNNATGTVQNASIQGCKLHAQSCSAGIVLRAVNDANIKGNTIAVDSGTVPYGIEVTSEVVAAPNAVIEGNNLKGGATFTTPVFVGGTGKQVRRNNTVNGVLVENDLASFALAADGGKRILTGTATITISSGTKVGTVASVTFPAGTFANPPQIQSLTLQNGNALADAEKPISFDAYSISANGFNIETYCAANVSATRTLTVGYTAVG